MNLTEMSRHLDELYNDMTVNELWDRLKRAGLIVFEGPFGFIELGEELEPIKRSE